MNSSSQEQPLFLHHLTDSLLSLSETLENSHSLLPRPAPHAALSMIKKLEDLVTHSIQSRPPVQKIFRTPPIPDP